MPTNDALTRLIESGIIGALLVLAIIAIVFLYRENQKIREARLQDLKDVWAKDMEMRKEIKYLLDNILQILRGKEK